MEREPEHTDDSPLRPVENAVEVDADDRVLDDDADFTDQRVTTDAGLVVEETDGDVTYFAPTDPVHPTTATRARAPRSRHATASQTLCRTTAAV